MQDKKSYKLLPEKSTLREDDVVLVPNVPLLSAAVHVKRMPAFKRLLVTGTIKLFEEPLFKRLTAHEYLWGYRDKIISLESLGGGKTHFGLLKTVRIELNVCLDLSANLISPSTPAEWHQRGLCAAEHRRGRHL